MKVISTLQSQTHHLATRLLSTTTTAEAADTNTIIASAYGMSFSARMRRSNLSNKVPNVKLRPAPILSKPSSKNVKNGGGQGQEDEEMGLMDKEVIRRLNEADNLAGESCLRSIGRLRIETEVLMTSPCTDEETGDAELKHAQTSLPFKGLIICFSAVPSDIRNGLIKKLHSMGVSKVEGNLTMDTSALISDSFDSVKYQVRILSLLSSMIAVLNISSLAGRRQKSYSGLHDGMDREDTLDLVVRRGREQDIRESMQVFWNATDPLHMLQSDAYRSYALPPFADLKISISGIEPCERLSAMCRAEY
jgi:hypothetical protein